MGVATMRRAIATLLLLVNLTFGVLGAHAAEITVAVASNFLAAEHELARAFAKRSGHHVLVSAGSTGKLFTQISQGAPFDIFMAADTVRPRKLIELGLAVESSYFVYATGRLALWSPVASSADDVKSMLLDKRYKYLALANPKTAPYGAAAVQVMRSLNAESREHLVFGENISQCYQFVQTGHADLGFVALSQLVGREPAGSLWVVPQQLHAPIQQAAVLLKASQGSERGAAAQAYIDFLHSDSAMAIIASFGYGVSGDSSP
ncbi:MAG TPA: molybdate ABC transporter substrate-binding protein [Hyphomicrobiales bacterium]|nr:molybdate ABC transporter substrate-binding protein [Hyphomicrobiales bacterium]